MASILSRPQYVNTRDVTPLQMHWSSMSFLAVSHMYQFSPHQTRSDGSMLISQVTLVPIGYIQLTSDQDDLTHWGQSEAYIHS